MAEDPKITTKSLLTQMDRMVLLLAVAVLVAAIALFLVFAAYFHSSSWRDLTLAVTANVVTSVLIYIAIYFSLSRVVETRRRVEAQDLVDQITAGLSSKQTLQLAAENISAAENITPDKPRRTHISRGHLEPAQHQLIERFLQATYLLIVALTKNHDIRIYCHTADQETGLLYPTNIVSVHRDDDYTVLIPFRGPESQPFIIAQAMRSKQIAKANLPTDHRDSYPDDLKQRIRASLKCVIAAPIMDYDPREIMDYHPNDQQTIPLGTISLDCDSADLDQLGMVNPEGDVVDEINDILKSCARVVYLIL